MGPSLSQVLLTNDYWKNRLTSVVPRSRFGVEWAAGRGALTNVLVDYWKYLLVLELDAEFCTHLRSTFDPNAVGVVRADLTKFPLPSREEPYPVVGNLPYHITGPSLMKLARSSNEISVFYGLVQEEVARRVSASPGESEFRSISLLLQWFFEVKWLESVPSSAFTPEPEVDSGWIELTPRADTWTFEFVREFTEICFGQPRKTLLNNLARQDEKQFWKDWFQERGWNPKIRPHALPRKKYLEVYETWKKRSS